MLTLGQERQISGITMIEMLISMLLLAIVLSIGAPATARWVRQSEIRSSAESLRSALQKARSEAIARNTRIRTSLGDNTGLARWSMGCVRVSTACPHVLHEQTVPSASSVRWGATRFVANDDLSVGLAVGASMPGSVDFFPLGDAPLIATGNDIARIDILHARDDTAGRLVVRIDGAGNIRICDPALPVTNVRRCR